MTSYYLQMVGGCQRQGFFNTVRQPTDEKPLFKHTLFFLPKQETPAF